MGVFKCIFFRVLSFLLCHKLTGRSSYLLFNNIVIHMVGNDKEIVINSHKLPMENKTKVVSCLFAAAVADPLGAGAVGDGCELKKVFYLSLLLHQLFMSAHNFPFPLNLFMDCFNFLTVFLFICMSVFIFKLFLNRFVLPFQRRQLLLPNGLISSPSKMD